MPTPVEISAPRTPTDHEAIKALMREYAGSLGFSLAYQDFETELADFPGKYAPPEGALLLATVSGEAAGTVALRKLDAITCEMKRLYVKPAFRGHGVGRALVEGIIQKACARGCKEVKLDMLPKSTVARGIYERMGFKPIAPYDADPHHAIFLGLDLCSQRTC